MCVCVCMCACTLMGSLSQYLKWQMWLEMYAKFEQENGCETAGCTYSFKHTEWHTVRLNTLNPLASWGQFCAIINSAKAKRDM